MGLTGNEIEDSLLQVVRLILYVLKLSFCRNLPGFCSPSHIAEDICLKNLVLLQSQFSLFVRDSHKFPLFLIPSCLNLRSLQLPQHLSALAVLELITDRINRPAATPKMM